MPDITMCEGKNCPIKNTCYRYTAKADSYQTYFTESPYIKNDKIGTCEYWWDNKGY